MYGGRQGCVKFEGYRVLGLALMVEWNPPTLGGVLDGFENPLPFSLTT